MEFLIDPGDDIRAFSMVSSEVKGSPPEGFELEPIVKFHLLGNVTQRTINDKVIRYVKKRVQRTQQLVFSLLPSPIFKSTTHVSCVLVFGILKGHLLETQKHGKVVKLRNSILEPSPFSYPESSQGL